MPCVKDGKPKMLGIRSALLQAHDIVEIFDPSPLVTFSLHRLLLVILHRCFGPRDQAQWHRIWADGRWDERPLTDYLRRWHSRFDLFAEERPFYQCSKVTLDYCTTPIEQLAQELASGDNPTLFDHSSTMTPASLPAAAAARLLVAKQSFSLGGLTRRQLEGEDPRENYSTKAALLSNCAAVLLTGDSLFQTLMLNLHPYSAEAGEPFEFDADRDCPCWEHDEQIDFTERYPYGYLDILSWQPHRIRLKPENGDDPPSVREIALLKGASLPDGFTRHGIETMVACTKTQRPNENQPLWTPVSFREGRAMWRDSLTLFRSVEESESRPKTIDWISDLVDRGILETTGVIHADVCGLSSHQAKAYFWRQKRLPLPLAYLKEEDLVEALAAALLLAEKADGILKAELRWMAEGLGAGKKDNLKESLPSQASRLYWSRLEIHFKNLLVALPQDVSASGGAGQFGLRQELPNWAATVRITAEHAFDDASNTLGTSGRAIKAVTLAKDALTKGIEDVTKPYMRNRKDGEKDRILERTLREIAERPGQPRGPSSARYAPPSAQWRSGL